MEFFKYGNGINAKKGRLLISEPYLSDPNFDRSVILLCEHNEEGSFGFVLNRPSKIVFDEIINDVEDFKNRIYIGGPVQQDTLHFIHKANYIEGGAEIINGLYWGGNYEQLLDLIQSGGIAADDFKFFVGYSGWDSGQLEEEMKNGAWIVTDHIKPWMIFDHNQDALWRDVLKDMGGRYNVYSNYPTDPRLN